MKRDDKLFSIGEIAKALGVTRRIILHYEERGLIEPDKRDDATNNRYYTIDTFTKLRSIRSLQNLGLTLDEIRDYYNDSTDLMPLIRRMEESGVIRGYHIDIDRTKLDCNITGFISVALEPDKYDKFCDFCASQSAIISHYHVVGEFNALLRFAVRDTQQLDQLLSLIKKFGDSRTSIELKTLFDSKEIPLP